MGDSCICERFHEQYKSKSIAWRELYAIVISAATWDKHLRGKRVKFICDNHICDNQTICDVLKSGTSKSVDIMELVCVLYYS